MVLREVDGGMRDGFAIGRWGREWMSALSMPDREMEDGYGSDGWVAVVY